ncbi:MAG: phage tail protein [Gammaproteobacteria bacterium]|nr:phage tail protein [Gammaproteobacteria bacterium]
MRRSRSRALVPVAPPASPAAGAGGKRGRRPYVPREYPNTLRSNAVIRVVDLIAEGEIQGLATAGRHDGLESVHIDGVQVHSAEGGRAISGIDFEFTEGRPDQDPIDLQGFSGVEREVVVGEELLQDDPVVRSIDNPAVKIARVTMRFPRLVTTESNGDLRAAGVKFKIEWRAHGGNWTPNRGAVWYRGVRIRGGIQVHDKNTAPAEISWNVVLGGPAPRQIRITRINPNSESDKLHNSIHWARYTEIIPSEFTYPHSALAAIRAEADKFTGQIHKREYDVFGLIVQVPSNYDPQTRAYAGLWDGTFKRAWTDNGAWLAYHLLANKRFGLGREITAAQLSAAKWEFYACARFNDQLVPNGHGGVEPRFRCTGVVNRATEAKRLVDHLLGNFNAALYYGAGRIAPAQDRPEDPSLLVSNANVIDGAFEYEDLGHSERVSAVAMSFNDPDDGYKLGVELVVDDKLVQKYGYRQADKAAMFCTSRSQAQRMARYHLHAQEHESDTLRYRAGLDHAALRPGAIIKQTDQHTAGARLGFRVKIVGQTIYADSLAGLPPAAPGERWQFSVMQPDGSIQTAPVSAIDYNSGLITLSGGWTLPAPGAMAVIESVSRRSRLWRVISVAERDPMEYEVTARAHDPNKYAAVEQNTFVSQPDTARRPASLPAPAALLAEELLRLDGRHWRSDISIGVTHPAGLSGHAQLLEYQIREAVENNPFEPLAVTSSRAITHPDQPVGREFIVRARYTDADQFSVGPWSESAPLLLAGKSAKPAQIRARDFVSADPAAGTLVIRLADKDPHAVDPAFSHYTYWLRIYSARRFDEIVETRQLRQSTAAQESFTRADLIPDELRRPGQVQFGVSTHDTADPINGGSAIRWAPTRERIADNHFTGSGGGGPPRPGAVVFQPSFFTYYPTMRWDIDVFEIRNVRWLINAREFPIVSYLEGRGNSPDTVSTAANLKTTQPLELKVQLPPDCAGNCTTAEIAFNIKARDTFGRYGPGDANYVGLSLRRTFEGPQPVQVRYQTHKNRVSFHYSAAPARIHGSNQTIAKYTIEWEGGREELPGDSTHTVIETIRGGSLEFTFKAYDQWGLNSTPTVVTVAVTAPTDYTFYDNISLAADNWPARDLPAATPLQRNGKPGVAGPVSKRTFAQVGADRRAINPGAGVTFAGVFHRLRNNRFADNHPHNTQNLLNWRWLGPTATAGAWVTVIHRAAHDLGQTIAAAHLQLQARQQAVRIFGTPDGLAMNPGLRYQLRHAPAATGPWTTINAASAWAENFRFVEFKVEARRGFVHFEDVSLKIDKRAARESGEITTNHRAPTRVLYSLPFIKTNRPVVAPTGDSRVRPSPDPNALGYALLNLRVVPLTDGTGFTVEAIGGAGRSYLDLTWSVDGYIP